MAIVIHVHLTLKLNVTNINERKQNEITIKTITWGWNSSRCKRQSTTEKEAVMLVKRICGPETNYRVNPAGSKLFRKRIAAKPKGISKRQHGINILMYAEENGSKRAAKDLAKF